MSSLFVVIRHQVLDDSFGLPIVGAVVVIAISAHGPMETLDDAVRFWVPWFRLDLDPVVGLDHGRDIAVDELAPMVVEDARCSLLNRVERRLPLDCHGLAVSAHQEPVVPDIAAVGVDKAEPEGAAGRHPDVHHVRVPLRVWSGRPEIVLLLDWLDRFPRDKRSASLKTRYTVLSPTQATPASTLIPMSFR